MTGAPAPACVVCGGSALVPHLKVAGAAGEQGLIPTTDSFGTALADIVRCTGCGHMQLERFPAEVELEAAYGEAASEDYVEEAAGQRATAAHVLQRVEAHVTGRRLVDLGCWVGFLLAEAGTRGWRGIGVEPSHFAAGYARERLGLDVRVDDLFRADLGGNAFDVVVMADVIEHLTDPGGALERSRELLAEGGALALVLPDAGSRVARMMGRRWWSVIPTHVQFFTRASISRLLGRHGFEVLEITTSPKSFTVRYYLQRIGGYSAPLAGALVRTAERLGLAQRLWAPDFRDRMLVIAIPATQAQSTAAGG